MIIKKTNSEQTFIIKNALKKFYKRKGIVSISVAIVLLVYSFFLLYYGMVLQKNQAAAKLQQIVFDGLETRLKIIPNYFNGLISNPQNFNLDIDFKDIQKLDYVREKSLKRGIIIENDKSVEVDADLSILNKKYEVKISPTGRNLDMIGDPNKYAYKVKVKSGDRILGMSEFKLIPPKSRNHIVEWIGHQIEKKEGLVSLRYDFIKVNINGSSKGIYAIEEHFNKELIENNYFKEGILFSLSDNNDLMVFNKKKVNRNEPLNNQLKFLQIKWEAFLNGDIQIEKVFDIKKYATFFSIIDLMDGHHAAIKMNLKMYLNPVTNLIEPIVREYNSLRYSDGPPNSPLMIEIINKEIDNYFFLFSELSKNNLFIELYLNSLIKLSNKEYLNDFFQENKKLINEKLNIIYKDEPYYSFPKEYMYLRQKQIQDVLSNLKLKLNIYYNSDSNNVLSIRIDNKTNIPIQLSKIVAGDSLFHNFNNIIIDGGTSHYINKINSIDINHYKIKYSLPGLTNYEKESFIIPRSFSKDTNFSEYSIISDENIVEVPYLIINQNNKLIMFKNYDVVINENLIIPQNYKLLARPGQNIDLKNNASIISYSPLEFIGEKNNYINIFSSDSTGQGITIIGSLEQSIFNNVVISNISNPKNFGWELSGSINIYESDIKIYDSKFINNRSEDYINIVRSKYEINRCLFENIYSDAFDGDFSDGYISNSSFINCANDAIDISGSNVIIDSVFIQNSGDKGISVGEGSILKATDITIIDSEIGVTSKDNSLLEIENIKIENTRLGFTAYQKKPEYGPGRIIVNKYKLSNVELSYLIENGSNMNANGKIIPTSYGKIEELLYGVVYGKRSN